MRKLGLLIAAGSLWLFLAAVPALADGGPHLTSVNSGTSSLTADSCAGCHRAHTAQGEYLLAAPSEEALCLSCHGSAGTGATVDVENGIQYVPTGSGERDATLVSQSVTDVTAGVITIAGHGYVDGQTVRVAGLAGVANGVYMVHNVTANTFELEGADPDNDAAPTGTVSETAPTGGVFLGALRDGGFINARIGADTGVRVAYNRGYDDSPFNTKLAVSERPKVPVGASEAVKSAHIDLSPGAGDGIADTGRLWGSGQAGVGEMSIELTCVECHNPHGNGNYRILRPVPGIESDPLGTGVATAVKATFAESDTLVTKTQHGLVQFDEIVVDGVGNVANGTYYVQSVVNGFTIKLATTKTGGVFDITASDETETGTVLRDEVVVTDYTKANNPTKNYTIIQTKGTQGVDSSFLLFASDVVAARSAGGLAGVSAAGPSINVGATSSSGTPLVYSYTTAAPHGLSVGDRVTLTGVNGAPDGNDYTVFAVGGSAAGFTTFRVISSNTASPTEYPTSTQAAGGTVSRNAIAAPASFSPTSGDYFRRSIPWNPALTNASCDNTALPSSYTSAYCGTMNDAPNGQPATIGTNNTPSALRGEKAFLDEMSTWCAACHTRYYSASNENPGGYPNVSNLESYVNTTAAAGSNPATAPANRITGFKYSNNPPTSGSTFSLPSLGDQVKFYNVGANTLLLGGGTAANPAALFVVNAGGSGGSAFIQVATSATGAPIALTDSTNTVGDVDGDTGLKVVRVAQSSASSWGYPRTQADGTGLDPTYKYQHSTASNRACTVCHVGHGSNAAMPGQDGTTFSPDMPYPDGTTTSTSSRLLKVDNRGTCQMCHDPTGTIAAGGQVGTGASATIP